MILELAARESRIDRIVVASRNVAKGTARVTLARLGAIAQGADSEVRFVKLDVNDKDAVAETVHREKPQLIVHTATLQSWWLPDLLPGPQAALIKSAGFGGPPGRLSRGRVGDSYSFGRS